MAWEYLFELCKLSPMEELKPKVWQQFQQDHLDGSFCIYHFSKAHKVLFL